MLQVCVPHFLQGRGSTGLQRWALAICNPVLQFDIDLMQQSRSADMLVALVVSFWLMMDWVKSAVLWHGEHFLLASTWFPL